MSGHAYTPTRELASAAAQKASDAYAMARRVEGGIARGQAETAALAEMVAALRAEVAALRDVRATPARKAPR